MLAIATTTTTAVVPRSGDSVLVLRLRARPDDAALIERVLDLLQRYGEERDPLSRAISTWGKETCVLVLEGTEAGVLERITHLRRCILINPLDGAPLRKPMIEGERVWEKWMLEHCVKLFVRSPFDDMPWRAAVPHRFATALVEVLGAPEETGGEAFLDPDETQVAVPAVARQGYRDLARVVLENEGKERVATVLQKATAEFEVSVAATRRRATEHVQALRDGLAESSRAQDEAQELERRSHDRVVTDLRTALAASREDVRGLGERLSTAERRITALEGEQRSLRGQLQNLAAQNEQNRQAAQSGGGGGCCVM